MIIKPDASPDEFDSPFFKKNEQFCIRFENFITTQKGRVKGKYNAFSYLIFGKITNTKNWNLMYRKATFTSTGNLFISSKLQGPLVIAEWETSRKGTHNSEFTIRKKTRSDFIKLRLFNSSSKLDISTKYILEFKNNKPQLVSKLTTILKPLFDSNEIYSINHRDDKLKIELKTEEHHFDIFQELFKL